MLEEAPSTDKTPEEVQDQITRITTKLAERAGQSADTPAEAYDRGGVSSIVRQKADGSTTTSVATGDVFKGGISGATIKENNASSQVEVTSMQPDGNAATLKLEMGSAPQLEQYKPNGNSEEKTPSVPEIISVSAPILEDIRSKTELTKNVASIQKFSSLSPVREQKAA